MAAAYALLRPKIPEKPEQWLCVCRNRARASRSSSDREPQRNPANNGTSLLQKFFSSWKRLRSEHPGKQIKLHLVSHWSWTREGDEFGQCLNSQEGSSIYSRMAKVGSSTSRRSSGSGSAPARTKSHRFTLHEARDQLTPSALAPHKDVWLVGQVRAEAGEYRAPARRVNLEVILQRIRRLCVIRRYRGAELVVVRLHCDGMPALRLICLPVHEIDLSRRSVGIERYRYFKGLTGFEMRRGCVVRIQ